MNIAYIQDTIEHFKEDHGNDDKPQPTIPTTKQTWKCETCEKEYPTKAYLEKHEMRVHGRDKGLKSQLSQGSQGSQGSQESQESHKKEKAEKVSREKTNSEKALKTTRENGLLNCGLCQGPIV